MDQQDTRKVQEFTPISEINYNQDTIQKQDFPEVIQLAREKEELIKWLIGQLYEAKKVCLELTKENNNELQTHLKILKRIIEESWERAHSFYNNLQQSVGEFSVSHESEGQHGANSFLQDDLARQTSEVCKQTVEQPSQQEEQFEMRRGSEQFRQSELFSDHNYSHYQQQQQKQNQQIMSLEEEPQSPIAQIQDHEINQRHQQLKNKYKQNIDTLRQRVISQQQHNSEKIQQMLEEIRIEAKQAKLTAFQGAANDIAEFKQKIETILIAQQSSQQIQQLQNLEQRQNQLQQSRQQPAYQINQRNQEQTFNQQGSIKNQFLEMKEMVQEFKQQLDDLRQDLETNKLDNLDAVNEQVSNLLGRVLKEKNKQLQKLQKQFQQQQQQHNQTEEKQNADFQKIKGISDKLSQESEQHKITKRELEKLRSQVKDLQLTCEQQNAELEQLRPFMLNKIQDSTIQSRLAQFQEQQQTTLNINQETARNLNQMYDLNSQIQEIRKSITGDYQKQIKELQNQLKEKQQQIQKLEEQNQSLEQKLLQNDLSGKLNETLKKLEEKEEIIRQKTLENSEKASEIESFKKELKIVSDYIKEDNKKYKEKVQQEFDEILKFQLEGSLTVQLNTLLFVFMTLKIFKQYLVSENQDPAKIDQQIDKVNKFNLKLQKKENQGLKESKIIEKFYKDLNNEVTEMITCTQKEHENLIKAFQTRRKEI